MMVSRWVLGAALVVLGALLVLADDEKRADMSAAPFVLGSRYGRSQPRMLAPRNDRFFMGSRYGKRSWSPPAALPAAPAAPLLCHCTPLSADRERRSDEVMNDADD